MKAQCSSEVMCDHRQYRCQRISGHDDCHRNGSIEWGGPDAEPVMYLQGNGVLIPVFDKRSTSAKDK